MTALQPEDDARTAFGVIAFVIAVVVIAVLAGV